MDQNWNNSANNASMPAPNMDMEANAAPINGMGRQQPMQQQPMQQQAAGQQPAGQQPMQQQAQIPVAPVPNMNMNGSAPVIKQPGVAPMAPAQATPKSGKSTLIETIILVIVCLIAAGAIIVAVIFFIRYNELNDTTEARINATIAEEVAKEQEKSAKKIEEERKEPRQEFRGPSDYGSISFKYPKNWSVYINKDGSNNSDFEAYFQPNKVPSLSDPNSRYALRFIIKNRQFDDEAKAYIARVKNGKLKSQNFSADSDAISGTRYEGEIDNKINGVFVMFKVNDKTAILQTDSVISPELLEEYEKITQSLRRNTN